MKKLQVLKHFPNLKQYKKDIKAHEAEVVKLENEIEEKQDILDNLEGVILHGEFPLFVDETSDTVSPSVEVVSACDDSTRYAYASRDSDNTVTPERWRATGYKQENDGNGKVLVEGASRLAAIRAAKDYVATGKLVKAGSTPAATNGETPAPKKRGRKPKVAVS